ncbi:MAG: sigma factor [Candidatus Binataceae bacterium]
MRDDHDAQDAVQDACVRALRFFGSLRGGDSRVWLLAIVRNVCYTRLTSGRAREHDASFDEELHATDTVAGDNPEPADARARRSCAPASHRKSASRVSRAAGVTRAGRAFL